MTEIESELFWRSPEIVAPRLLGWTLRHAGVELRIVETEAYLGTEDAASHARSGPTQRARTMYGPVGRAYIYKSYGIHLCFNIVCHRPEAGGAVLVRAGTVTEGADTAARRRGRIKGLANGPGKLAQCLGLSEELDGSSLYDGPIELRKGVTSNRSMTIVRGPRIGISQNQNPLLRFWLHGCEDVSKPNKGGVPL